MGKSHEENIYKLVRFLGSNGYLLGIGTGLQQHLTVIKGIYYIKCESEFEQLKREIADKEIFGHILYIDSINVPQKGFKSIKAIHSFGCDILNSNLSDNIFDINHVIPRPTTNGWICGIFIGDKNIEQHIEPNNFNDLYEGGIIEIRSDHIIPKEITNINRMKRTVGIFVDYGTRVVLKIEKMNMSDPKWVTILLLGGSFIWLETDIEFRYINQIKQIISEPIHQFLRTNTQFFYQNEQKVPFFRLTKNESRSESRSECRIEWALHLKTTNDGRSVTIEAPKDWWNRYLLFKWDQFQIERHLYKINYPPRWDKQDSLPIDQIQATTDVGLVNRTKPLKIEVNPNLNAMIGRKHPIEEFEIKNKFWLYYMRRDERFQIVIRSERIVWKELAGVTGPLFILYFEEDLIKLVFSLVQREIYGTFAYVVKLKPSKQTDDEYTQIHAFIVGKSHKTFNCKPIVIHDILWKKFDDKVWIRGLVIGGIDVIRKRPLRIYKRMPETESQSETESIINRRHEGIYDTKEHKIIGQTHNFEKQMNPYKIRRNAKKIIQKNIALKLIEYPKVIEDWNYSQEIRTDFILPDKKEGLPFFGKIIGLYIPSGVKCVLINSVVDDHKFDPLRDIHQNLVRHKLHPILLLEKTFIWIEGVVKMNLLENTNDPTLKQLISDQHIIGEIEGIECEKDLFGKVLFLGSAKDEMANWSIEVSPLIYPTYERRVLYLNIPSGGKIEIKDWDKAFDETISRSNSFNIQQNEVQIVSNIPLKRWINRDFKQRIYEFLEICVDSLILKEIPNTYRNDYLRTRREIFEERIKCIKNFADTFFVYENSADKHFDWLFIIYMNFDLDHYGLLKINTTRLQMFEDKFKHHFYDQFI